MRLSDFLQGLTVLGHSIPITATTTLKLYFFLSSSHAMRSQHMALFTSRIAQLRSRISGYWNLHLIIFKKKAKKQITTN